MPEDVLERTFAESAKFFKRPRGEKDALAWTTPEVSFFFFVFFCYFGKNLIILPTPAVAAEVGILLMTFFSFYSGQ